MSQSKTQYWAPQAKRISAAILDFVLLTLAHSPKCFAAGQKSRLLFIVCSSPVSSLSADILARFASGKESYESFRSSYESFEAFCVIIMGIHGLSKVIGDHAPSGSKENEIKNYFGKW